MTSPALQRMTDAEIKDAYRAAEELHRDPTKQSRRWLMAVIAECVRRDIDLRAIDAETPQYMKGSKP